MERKKRAGADKRRAHRVLGDDEDEEIVYGDPRKQFRKMLDEDNQEVDAKGNSIRRRQDRSKDLRSHSRSKDRKGVAGGRGTDDEEEIEVAVINEDG